MKIYPSVEDLISDSEIKRVHGFSEFGTQNYRYIVNESLLKCASGYHNGHTAQTILYEHGLIKAIHGTGSKTLTSKGKKYLYSAFAGNF